MPTQLGRKASLPAKTLKRAAQDPSVGIKVASNQYRQPATQRRSASHRPALPGQSIRGISPRTGARRAQRAGRCNGPLHAARARRTGPGCSPRGRDYARPVRGIVARLVFMRTRDASRAQCRRDPLTAAISPRRVDDMSRMQLRNIAGLSFSVN